VLRDEIFVTFDGLLHSRDEELHDALFTLNNGGEQSKLSEHTPVYFMQNVGASCLSVLMDIFLRFVFVDVVTMETLLFLWDQLILGTREFASHSFLPNASMVLSWICTIHAARLHEPLLSCKEEHEIEAIAMSHSRFIVPEDYTTELGEYYAPYISKLNLVDKKDENEMVVATEKETKVKSGEAVAEAVLTQPQAPANPSDITTGEELSRPAMKILAETVQSNNKASQGEISFFSQQMQPIVESVDEPTGDAVGDLRSISRAITDEETVRIKEEHAHQKEMDEDMRQVEAKEFGRALTEEERESMLPEVKASFERKLKAYQQKKSKPPSRNWFRRLSASNRSKTT
jgi:hypothetical protein